MNATLTSPWIYFDVYFTDILPLLYAVAISCLVILWKFDSGHLSFRLTLLSIFGILYTWTIVNVIFLVRQQINWLNALATFIRG